MTKREVRTEPIDWKALLTTDGDVLRPLVEAVVQATLEAEMAEALGAAKGERTPARLGYRSGYYSRSLITRVGTLELRVPQDRQGRFSTEIFERYQRSEKALVGALATGRDCPPVAKSSNAAGSRTGSASRGKSSRPPCRRCCAIPTRRKQRGRCAPCSA